MSNKYGMACDNVVNFEVCQILEEKKAPKKSADEDSLFKVVLANGNIINANNMTNTDLFWALKGGTNNFGRSHASIGYEYR